MLPLTNSLEPDGEPCIISHAELDKEYGHEPGLSALMTEDTLSRMVEHLHTVLPVQEPDLPDDWGEATEDGVPANDEEVERAARADFAVALTSLRRGDLDHAVHLFNRLVGEDRQHPREHRHMFTEFGINLRKSGLPDMAVKHHEYALGLNPSDDHIHFNIARAYYDMGKVQKALSHLDESLKLNPDLAVSQLFKAYILQQTALRR